MRRRLRQHLLLRGSREFAAETDYEHFLERVLERSNHCRREKLAAELAVMTALPPTRLSEYDKVMCRVGSASTIRVKKVGYGSGDPSTADSCRASRLGALPVEAIGILICGMNPE